MSNSATPGSTVPARVRDYVETIRTSGDALLTIAFEIATHARPVSRYDLREVFREIAVAAGFCDQSHMNRCFRAVLGRTPLVVRGEIGADHALRSGDSLGDVLSPYESRDTI